MPTGPKGQKRPPRRDKQRCPRPQIATGEVKEAALDDGKAPEAKALGAKGGAARAKSMTPERRAEIEEGSGQALGPRASIVRQACLKHASVANACSFQRAEICYGLEQIKQRVAGIVALPDPDTVLRTRQSIMRLRSRPSIAREPRPGRASGSARDQVALDVQVFWTAACTDRKRWADPRRRKRCILRSLRRTG